MSIDLIWIKVFIFLCGFWNIVDGIVSVRSSRLGHFALADICRVIRAMLGLGLVICVFFL